MLEILGIISFVAGALLLGWGARVVWLSKEDDPNKCVIAIGAGVVFGAILLALPAVHYSAVVAHYLGLTRLGCWGIGILLFLCQVACTVILTAYGWGYKVVLPAVGLTALAVLTWHTGYGHALTGFSVLGVLGFAGMARSAKLYYEDLLLSDDEDDEDDMITGFVKFCLGFLGFVAYAVSCWFLTGMLVNTMGDPFTALKTRVGSVIFLGAIAYSIWEKLIKAKKASEVLSE